jgi:hypothetical protein
MGFTFRTLRSRIARKLSRVLFHPLERGLDLHLTVNDYYSPIPSVKDLSEDVYERPFSLIGIDMQEERQLAFLEKTLPDYAGEYSPQPNGGLSLLDAFVLYATVRARKPSLMVEIGGGDSTLITLRALAANRAEGHPGRLVCVEPYPRPMLGEIDSPDFELVEMLVQDVALSMFEGADIIFIDSSHVSKIGSDVNHEMFEIVPRAKTGCLIHWHDIVLPTNYWRDWTHSGGQFWNESYLLHAFLSFNSAFAVRWAARWMKLQHPERLTRFAPYLRPEHRLTSFWVERVG